MFLNTVTKHIGPQFQYDVAKLIVSQIKKIMKIHAVDAPQDSFMCVKAFNSVVALSLSSVGKVTSLQRGLRDAWPSVRIILASSD